MLTEAGRRFRPVAENFSATSSRAGRKLAKQTTQLPQS